MASVGVVDTLGVGVMFAGVGWGGTAGPLEPDLALEFRVMGLGDKLGEGVVFGGIGLGILAKLGPYLVLGGVWSGGADERELGGRIRSEGFEGHLELDASFTAVWSMGFGGRRGLDLRSGAIRSEGLEGHLEPDASPAAGDIEVDDAFGLK